MRTPIACCAILLAACAATEPIKPVETIEVRIPVPVPCVDQVPDVPKSVMPDPISADLAQLAAGAASDVYALRAYSERAHALLLQCAQPSEEP